MWPVKPQIDVQSEEPATQFSFKEKQKKCKYDHLDSQSTVLKCSDKNCQENGNSVMWSVTKETDMQLPKPEIRRLCSDKKCQSTRCYTKYDKNCQL